jgi:hypothetical protein
VSLLHPTLKFPQSFALKQGSAGPCLVTPKFKTPSNFFQCCNASHCDEKSIPVRFLLAIFLYSTITEVASQSTGLYFCTGPLQAVASIQDSDGEFSSFVKKSLKQKISVANSLFF